MKFKCVILLLIVSTVIAKSHFISNNISKYEDFKPKSEMSYIVKEGDSLATIATKFKPKHIRLNNP